MADFDITANIAAVLGVAAKLYADQLSFAAARVLTLAPLCEFFRWAGVPPATLAHCQLGCVSSCD